MRNIKKAVFVSAASVSMVMAGAAAASAVGSGAEGAAVGSPGVVSGNVIQVPVDVPINLCGNTIDVIGLINPAFGNTCINASDVGGRRVERGHEERGREFGSREHGRERGWGGERGHNRSKDDC